MSSPQLSLAPRVQMVHAELRALALSLSSLGTLQLAICLSVFVCFMGTLTDVAGWGEAPGVGWVNGDHDCSYYPSKIPSPGIAFSLGGSSLPPRCTAYAYPIRALYSLWALHRALKITSTPLVWLSHGTSLSPLDKAAPKVNPNLLGLVTTTLLPSGHGVSQRIQNRG